MYEDRLGGEGGGYDAMIFNINTALMSLGRMALRLTPNPIKACILLWQSSKNWSHGGAIAKSKRLLLYQVGYKYLGTAEKNVVVIRPSRPLKIKH